jgi:putative membrane protein
MHASASRAAGGLLLLAGGTVIAADAIAVDQAPPAQGQTRPADEESLALVQAINLHEIELARLALTRPAARTTQAMATVLVQEHTRNEAAQARLGIAPRQTQAVLALQRQQQAETDALTALAPDAFEPAYIDAMVKDHMAAKDLLDKRAGVARLAPVRAYLLQTRTAVEDHLSQARKLQTGAVGK